MPASRAGSAAVPKSQRMGFIALARRELFVNGLPAAQRGEGAGSDRGIDGAEARVEAQRPVEILLGRTPFALLRADHPRVEQEGGLGRAESQRLRDHLPGLLEAAVLVVTPGERVRGKDVLPRVILR